MKAQICIIEELRDNESVNPIWVSYVLFKNDTSAVFNGKTLQEIDDLYQFENSSFKIIPLSKRILNSTEIASRKIYIDKQILDYFLEHIGEDKIDPAKHVLITLNEISIGESTSEASKLIYASPKKLTLEELKHAISILSEKEKIQNYKRAKRFYTKKRIRFEGELDKRLDQ